KGRWTFVAHDKGDKYALLSYFMIDPLDQQLLEFLRHQLVGDRQARVRITAVVKQKREDDVNFWYANVVHMIPCLLTNDRPFGLGGGQSPNGTWYNGHAQLCPNDWTLANGAI